MKAVTLFIFILIIASSSAYSQNEIASKFDKSVMNLRLSTDLKSLQPQKKDSFETYKLPEFKSQLDTAIIGRIIPKTPGNSGLSFQKAKPGHMPVVSPKGNFRMPVMVPDSTIDFSLRIVGPK